MSSLVRTLQFTDDPKDVAQFVALPSPGRDCEPLLLNRILKANAQWTSVVPASGYQFPISLVCHLLAGGPSCLAFSFEKDAPESRRRFEERHKRCVEHNRALILRPPSTSGAPVREFLLAPLWGAHPTQGTVRVLGMYEASHLAGDFLLQRVLAPRRLPVVFDLDETLVKARSLSSLQRDANPEELKNRKVPLMADPLLSLPEKLSTCAGYDKEFEMANMDFTVLKEYSRTNQATLPGGERRATLISCPYYPRGGPAMTVQRPVLYLDADNLLTRIKPHQTEKETSMVFRIRPHWLNAARPRLAGDAPYGSGRPIVDASVCTTAEVDYAHEVWRVLDSTGRLIPAAEWPKRILAEVKTKFLAPALGLATYNVNAVAAAVSPMPLAVILDDRTDVWEAAVQGQILDISKWEPYEEYAQCSLHNIPWGKGAAALDMLRAGAVLIAMHDRVFKEIEGKLVPAMQGSQKELRVPLDLSSAQAAQASYNAALPPPPWADRLLPELRQTVQPLPVPVLLAGPPQPPPPAAPAAAVPRVPQDPRMAPAAPARQASGAVPAAVAAPKPRPAAAPAAAPAISEKAANDAFLSLWTNAGLGRSDSVPAPRAAEPHGAAAAAGANNAQLFGKRKRSDEADGSVDVTTDSEGQQLPGKKPAAGAPAPAPAAGPLEEPPLTMDHPVIKLSKLVQKQRKHLVYDCKITAQGGLLVMVKYGGELKGFANCTSKAEGMRLAAEKTLDMLQGGTGGGNEPSAAPAPAAAVPSAPAPGGAPVPFVDAARFLKSLFPKGAVSIDKVSGDEGFQKYHAVVKRRGAPDLTGIGSGRADFQAMRYAAEDVLKQLGYTVTPFVPKYAQ